MSDISQMPVNTTFQLLHFREAALSELGRADEEISNLWKFVLAVGGCKDSVLTGDDSLAATINRETDEYSDLLNEMDELKAHCERLRGLLETHSGWSDHSDGMITTIYPHPVVDAFDATPAQSLAEIQARAVEDAANSIELKYVLEDMPDGPHTAAEFTHNLYAEKLVKYANTLREEG